MLLSIMIALPGVLARWVFLKHPIGKIKAAAIAAGALVILVLLYTAGGGAGPPTFISLGCVFLYFALTHPLKEKAERDTEQEASRANGGAKDDYDSLTYVIVGLSLGVLVFAIWNSDTAPDEVATVEQEEITPNWQQSVDAFLLENPEFNDPAKASALEAALQELYRDPSTQGASYSWFLETAKRNVDAVSTGPSVGTQAPVRRTQAERSQAPVQRIQAERIPLRTPQARADEDALLQRILERMAERDAEDLDRPQGTRVIVIRGTAADATAPPLEPQASLREEQLQQQSYSLSVPAGMDEETARIFSGLINSGVPREVAVIQAHELLLRQRQAEADLIRAP